MSLVYLDCNATTPIDPRVRSAVYVYLEEEIGNAGSRTHGFGARAKVAVEHARDQVAKVVGAAREDVIFTSGATESNNIAILGLRAQGERSGRRHIVSTQIEHKAVLEPIEQLRLSGFDVTLLKPEVGGWVEPDRVRAALRPETLLVSVQHVNNETGVQQPLEEIATVLDGHEAFFHVDAAQGFGKDLVPLRHARIDFISVSGHKLHAPKGVGALVLRRRGYERPPLTPLSFGGGQERGLRPGTHPVHLIVGLGLAAELAAKEAPARAAKCATFKRQMLAAFAPLEPRMTGDPERTLPHVVNLMFPGVDSEALMVALKDQVAISNGSACTSQSYQPSHVLLAMGLSVEEAQTATRWSWSYLTPAVNWRRIVDALHSLR